MRWLGTPGAFSHCLAVIERSTRTTRVTRLWVCRYTDLKRSNRIIPGLSPGAMVVYLRPRLTSWRSPKTPVPPGPGAISISSNRHALGCHQMIRWRPSWDSTTDRQVQSLIARPQAPRADLSRCLSIARHPGRPVRTDAGVFELKRSQLRRLAGGRRFCARSVAGGRGIASSAEWGNDT